MLYRRESLIFKSQMMEIKIYSFKFRIKFKMFIMNSLSTKTICTIQEIIKKKKKIFIKMKF